jgi:anti-sigma-K factor RskA
MIEPDVTAAELALGLLEGDDRAAALRRVLADPSFASEVEAWRGHFGALFVQWPEAEVPDHVGQRLQQSIAPKRPRTNFWPIAAAASMLLAVALATVLALRPAPVPPVEAVPTLVASLASDRADEVPAVYQAAAGTLRMAAMPVVPSGRSAELWMIPADGIPRSLGVWDSSRPASIQLSAEARHLMAPGVKLAVSSEPAGGSPTALPTGPILASGTLIAV